MYLMTLIDRTTRWVQSVPLKGIAAASYIEALMFTWVAHFGMPQTLTSDRGTQFSSVLWSRLLQPAGHTAHHGYSLPSSS